jgi:epoxyqueuosine reductase
MDCDDPGTASHSLSPLHCALQDAAAAAGFAASGGVDLAAAAPSFRDHVGRLDSWLAQEYHSTMEWIRRGRDRRADPGLVLPGAKSIFCVLLPYSARTHGKLNPQEGIRYARYLAGPDYHEDIKGRLERMMAQAVQAHPGLGWKICVDTSAVLERSWAALAGLGWIGKNTMLIHPKLGSYTFIGSVLLDRELNAAPRPLPNWCGSCERCLTGCPTRAFPSAGVLDSRRCISALTLEYRSEALPEDPELATAPWVAGCDICQEVCPFNLKRSRLEAEDPQPGAQPARWLELETEDEETYRERIKNSALSRVKYRMFRRNLAAAKKALISRDQAPVT